MIILMNIYTVAREVVPVTDKCINNGNYVSHVMRSAWPYSSESLIVYFPRVMHIL